MRWCSRRRATSARWRSHYADRLPGGVRTLLRGLGSTQGTGANLMSYLLFDRDFCRALLALGFADTMARRDEVAAFLDGGGRDIPAGLSPPTANER